MKNDLLIYIDPGFLDNVGHYRNLATSIHKEAANRDVDIWHFVRKDISEESAEAYKVEGIFEYRAFLIEDSKYVLPEIIPSYSPLKQLYVNFVEKLALQFPSLDRHLQDIRQQSRQSNVPATDDETILKAFAVTLETILDRLIEKGYTYEKITIYMYTSSPLHFMQFARVLSKEKYARFDIAAHLYLFYLNLDFCLKKPYPAYEKMLKASSRILELYDQRNRINLYADSERTIKLYAPFFWREIHIAPISIFNNTPIAPQHQATDKDLVIGFFGYTHIKQGYHLIKQLYDNLIDRPEHSQVRFIVRHNIHYLTDEMQRLVDDFRGKTTRITHLFGDLPIEEYKHYISSCDIILIPHSKEWYPCQTSGLFVDSLRKGKVVVVPEDTWLADKLRKYGAGKTFESDNITSFTAAVEETIVNFPRYHAETGRNIAEFTKYHTVENLFDLMEIGNTKHV